MHCLHYLYVTIEREWQQNCWVKFMNFWWKRTLACKSHPYSHSVPMQAQPQASVPACKQCTQNVLHLTHSHTIPKIQARTHTLRVQALVQHPHLQGLQQALLGQPRRHQPRATAHPRQRHLLGHLGQDKSRTVPRSFPSPHLLSLQPKALAQTHYS